jgi:hypothetical protein
VWIYRYLKEAEKERNVLMSRDRASLINAEAKLTMFGPGLPYPHSSAVQAVNRLRELGSAWQAQSVAEAVRRGRRADRLATSS